MRRTVFIIGAGASAEFGMPLGSGLVDRIRSDLTAEISDGFNGLLTSTAMASGLSGNFGEAMTTIAGGMIAARSIDRFMHARRDQQLIITIGKLAIAKSIAEAEAATGFGGRPNTQWIRVHEGLLNSRPTWLARLFALLSEGVPPAQADQVFANVAFITFNYDRVIEFFLELSFQHVMSLPIIDAAAIVKGIPILHVYGSLGPLDSADGGIPFGIDENCFRYALPKMALGIQIFTEQHDEASLSNIRNLVSDADLIVPLGFSFDPLNVEALFDSPLSSNQTLLGTKLGLADSELTSLAKATDRPLHSLDLRNCSGSELVASPDFRGAILG